MSDVNNNGLTEIKLPDLTNPGFGAGMAKAFENIQNNFNKIANLALEKGPSGDAATYIPFNLNAIFMAPIIRLLYFLDDPIIQGAQELYGYGIRQWGQLLKVPSGYSLFCQGIYNTSVYDGCAWGYQAADGTTWIGELPEEDDLDSIKGIYTQVEKDFSDYHAITGNTRGQYVEDCFYILFGKDVFPVMAGDEGFSWQKIIKDGLDTGVGVIGALATDGINAAPVEVDRRNFYNDWIGAWLTAAVKANAANDEDIKKAREIFSTHFIKYGPGRIHLACNPPVNIKSNVLGSMPYVHMDPRFRNDAMARYSSKYKSLTDESCTLYARSTTEEGVLSFMVGNEFPTLYSDGSDWYWSINGYKSGILASGPAGEDGKDRGVQIFESIENLFLVKGVDGKEYEFRYTPWVGTSGGKWFYPDDMIGKEYVVNGSQKTITDEGCEVGAWPSAVLETKLFELTDIQNDKDYLNRFMFNGSTSNTHRIKENISTQEVFYAPIFATPGLTPGTEEWWEEGYRYGWKKADDSSLTYTAGDTAQCVGSTGVILAPRNHRQGDSGTCFWFGVISGTTNYNEDNKDIVLPVADISPSNMIKYDMDMDILGGMMMKLDPYLNVPGNNIGAITYPRGLMVPINSVLSAEVDDRFAAHIIYPLPVNPNKPDTTDAGATNNDEVTLTNRAVNNKRILHIGTTTNINNNGNTTADYLGDLIPTEDSSKLAELHVDEDLQVLGNTIIGWAKNTGGGLWVRGGLRKSPISGVIPQDTPSVGLRVDYGASIGGDTSIGGNATITGKTDIGGTLTTNGKEPGWMLFSDGITGVKPMSWANDIDNHYLYGHTSEEEPKYNELNGVLSPVVLDLGPEYGTRRLVKFGEVGSVEYDDKLGGIKITDVPHADDSKADQHRVLFGRYPKIPSEENGIHNIIPLYTGYFATITAAAGLDDCPYIYWFNDGSNVTSDGDIGKYPEEVEVHLDPDEKQTAKPPIQFTGLNNNNYDDDNNIKQYFNSIGYQHVVDADNKHIFYSFIRGYKILFNLCRYDPRFNKNSNILKVKGLRYQCGMRHDGTHGVASSNDISKGDNYHNPHAINLTFGINKNNSWVKYINDHLPQKGRGLTPIPTTCRVETVWDFKTLWPFSEVTGVGSSSDETNGFLIPQYVYIPIVNNQTVEMYVKGVVTTTPNDDLCIDGGALTGAWRASTADDKNKAFRNGGGILKISICGYLDY